MNFLTLQICLLGPLLFRGVMELFNAQCSSLRKADRVGAQTGSDVNEREREVTCPRTSNGLQRVLSYCKPLTHTRLSYDFVI